MISGLEEHVIEGNGIQIHFVTKGDGPAVVMCHGFPDSWYSWRNQIEALADAGYQAVAMSMRGYGKTSAPQAIDAYDINHLVGDVVAVTNHLNQGPVVIAGHDWGAPVAWFAGLMRPDLFRAVMGMSVPFINPIGALPEGIDLNGLMAQNAGPDRDYYRLFFQEPGKAEADLESDIERTMRGFLYLISGDALQNGDVQEPFDGHFPIGETLTQQLVIPAELPQWISEDVLAFYVEQITNSGFRGGLNWYRNINRLPAITAPFLGSTIEQPSFYMGGSTDLIAGNTPEAISTMEKTLSDLRHCEIIDGAGHWIQQERAAEVNAAMLTFLEGLD
jgi:pimeloyl-ACP methyl ester carboxylesterase